MFLFSNNIWSLECGFISYKGGIHHPVDSCTLNLREHGEGGVTPLDYGFEFTAGMKTTLSVKNLTINNAANKILVLKYYHHKIYP